MSLRANYDPFAMPTSPSREWTFGVFIYQNLPSITLTVSANAKFVSITYEFGLYQHNIRMNVNGHADDRVWRSGKLLSQKNSATELNYANSTAPTDRLPYFQSHFVAGAANGIFGIGITREERFPDVFIRVAIYEGLFVFQVVQQQINAEILSASIVPSTLEIDVTGSDMGQLIGTKEESVSRAIPQSVVVKAASNTTVKTTIAKPERLVQTESVYTQDVLNHVQKSNARLTKRNLEIQPAHQPVNNNQRDRDSQPKKGQQIAWYASDYGIGDKRSDLYLMQFEYERTSSPESGYRVRSTTPRNYGQVIPKFIADRDVDAPSNSGRKVSSACPDCRTTCSSPLEQTMYFKCAGCHTSWWQKR